MDRGTQKLSEILAELWDRANRVFPARTVSKRLLKWMLARDESSVTSDFSTEQPPYPAKWASGTFNPSENIYWSRGTWG